MRDKIFSNELVENGVGKKIPARTFQAGSDENKIFESAQEAGREAPNQIALKSLKRSELPEGADSLVV